MGTKCASTRLPPAGLHRPHTAQISLRTRSHDLRPAEGPPAALLSAIVVVLTSARPPSAHDPLQLKFLSLPLREHTIRDHQRQDLLPVLLTGVLPDAHRPRKIREILHHTLRLHHLSNRADLHFTMPTDVLLHLRTTMMRRHQDLDALRSEPK